MRKAAIQLSVNFVVVLIIAVIVFGLGLTFAYRLLSTASDIEEGFDADTNAQIEAMLNSGEAVAIPINRAYLKKGKAHVFGLGISNKGLGPGVTTFDVQVTQSAYFNLDGVKESKDFSNFFESTPQSYDIVNNEHKKVPIPIRVQNELADSSPTPFGTYVFNVNVSVNGTQYGSLQKIYVEVRS
ncbi:hypothetical protein D6745_02080 [Candidatus Woesearchaeota archaeon]|nr:MAG: hypothetical protein D6745_02080 [Candidatus Woesearchaeota archaeon]